MSICVITVWTLVVMFMLLQLCVTDVAHSEPMVELKNVTRSSSNNTSKLQPEKDVTFILNNTTEHTENETSGAKSSFGSMPRKMDSGALLRGFYVVVGIGAVILIYGVVKMIRLRRIRSTTVRKYGVLASQEDLEMAPLDADDEEEDTTLFDASRHNQL